MSETHFIDVLRDRTIHMKYVLVLSATSIVLLLFSLLYVEPGTSTYTLAIFQLVTFAFLFSAMSVLLWFSSRG